MLQSKQVFLTLKTIIHIHTKFVRTRYKGFSTAHNAHLQLEALNWVNSHGVLQLVLCNGGYYFVCNARYTFNSEYHCKVCLSEVTRRTWQNTWVGRGRTFHSHTCLCRSVRTHESPARDVYKPRQMFQQLRWVAVQYIISVAYNIV